MSKPILLKEKMIEAINDGCVTDAIDIIETCSEVAETYINDVMNRVDNIVGEIENSNKFSHEYKKGFYFCHVEYICKHKYIFKRINKAL